jgi:hypothetical protein
MPKYKDIVNDLKALAKMLEKDGKKFSADEQALIRMAASSIVAVVNRNATIKLYSHNEDD